MMSIGDRRRFNAINYLFSIIFVINREQKMDDLFEPHQPNTRLDLHSIFNSHHSQLPPRPNSDFVPFYQERDKLGKLISREQNRKKIETAASAEPTQARRRSLEVQLTERNKNSDKTVEKMFKVNTIRNSTSSRSLVKLKLALPQNKSSTPELGYYEAAQVTDKIKASKGSLIGLKQSRPPNKQQQKKVSALLLNKMGVQLQKKSKRQQPVRIREKLQLNPNLPQLQNFHRMQKLQFEIKGNFQKDHLRFKDIMRSSLLLANQIKRELELD